MWCVLAGKNNALFSSTCRFLSLQLVIFSSVNVEGSTGVARRVHHEPSFGGFRGSLRYLSRPVQPLCGGLVRDVAHQGSRTGIVVAFSLGLIKKT